MSEEHDCYWCGERPGRERFGGICFACHWSTRQQLEREEREQFLRASTGGGNNG